MADRVSIKELRVSTVIGVHEWERQVRQELSIDVDLYGDFSAAAVSDQLQDALDYQAVADKIRNYCQRVQCQLLEALTGGLAKFLLEEFSCGAVTVTITKSGAIAGAGGVIVSKHVDRLQ